jgi:uncharacterized membrane protein YidH (DUF202 family)
LPPPALLLAVLSAAVVCPLALFAWLMPTALVLPAFGLLAAAVAAVLAAADRVTAVDRPVDRPNLLDIAGSFALAAAAATIFADLDHVARWLGL